MIKVAIMLMVMNHSQQRLAIKCKIKITMIPLLPVFNLLLLKKAEIFYNDKIR